MDLRRLRTLALALCLDIELEVIEVPKRTELGQPLPAWWVRRKTAGYLKGPLGL